MILLTDRNIFYSFLIGLFSFIPIRIIGLLYISEIFLLLYSVLFFFSCYRNIDKDDSKIFKYLFLWALGCIISSYYNETSQLNFLKGFFSIIIFIPIFFSLTKFKNSSPLFYLYFLFGQALSLMLMFIFFPTENILISQEM